jgi:hypothetical protein
MESRIPDAPARGAPGVPRTIEKRGGKLPPRFSKREASLAVFLLVALLLLVLLILLVLTVLLLILIVLRHEGTPPFEILQFGCGPRRNAPPPPVQALFLPECRKIFSSGKNLLTNRRSADILIKQNKEGDASASPPAEWAKRSTTL